MQLNVYLIRMGNIRNALPEIMGRHRIKQTALAEAAGLRYATVNALYNGKTERVDFDTLAAVLDGLHTLTGKTYTVSDLLEYKAASSGPADESALMAGAADELRGQLEALEVDTSPDQLKGWAAAFEVPA